MTATTRQAEGQNETKLVYGDVVQWLERPTHNRRVRGSIPRIPTTDSNSHECRRQQQGPHVGPQGQQSYPVPSHQLK